MNAQTKLSAKGQVVIPKDVRDAMHLRAGERFDVVHGVDEIKLKLVDRTNSFARTNLAELKKKPRWQGKAKSIEEISRLSNEAILRVLLDQANRARD
jgi:AbrB family looped-hinge helix DNA binding protein